MKTYRVVCHQTGFGWLVNCDSEHKSKLLVIEMNSMYTMEDIVDLHSWELFVNQECEEVVDD